MQPYCITAVKIFHSWSTVATAAQLAMHKDWNGFEGNLIRQRHSRRFCLKTCSCRLTMKPSRGECQALRARPEREACNPQIHLLHLPQHLSHLEARKTDNDNAKQQKRKIEDNSNCSQPLACAQASHLCSNRRGKGCFPLTREPPLSSTKQAPLFHCTIVRLAAAHTFLMAEISRHALTDLRSYFLKASPPWEPYIICAQSIFFLVKVHGDWWFLATAFLTPLPQLHIDVRQRTFPYGIQSCSRTEPEGKSQVLSCNPKQTKQLVKDQNEAGKCIRPHRAATDGEAASPVNFHQALGLLKCGTYCSYAYHRLKVVERESSSTTLLISWAVAKTDAIELFWNFSMSSLLILCEFYCSYCFPCMTA